MTAPATPATRRRCLTVRLYSASIGSRRSYAPVHDSPAQKPDESETDGAYVSVYGVMPRQMDRAQKDENGKRGERRTERSVGPRAGESERRRHGEVDARHGRDAAEGNVLPSDIAHPEHAMRLDGGEWGDPVHALEIIEQRTIWIGRAHDIPVVA